MEGEMIIQQVPLWRLTRKKMSRCKRRLVWVLKYLKAPKNSLVDFRCNICGRRTCFPREKMGRESWSCWYCGSTVRWRSVISALSTELFGKSLVIDEFPDRPDLTGIGLSDWDGYADRLVRKLGYTNTFYHQEPLLDITDVNPTQHNQYDFMISSDVFEHICSPISKAFENAYRLLKPGGVLILTVPYLDGETSEHFPDVRQFSVEPEGRSWVLLGKTSDGLSRKYRDLTFHGGPGTVLEFRVFGKDSLLRDCYAAGFDSVRVHGEVVEEVGIYWNRYIPEDAPYRPLIYGLDTPPWALTKNLAGDDR
jgi:SAM-dependent methyltransferase